MGIGNLQIFSALKQKMQWNQTRQQLLAENIANAQTPGFKGRDLKQFSFGDTLDNSISHAVVTTVATNPEHFAVHNINITDGFEAQRMNNFEVTPEGNGVSLEDEMMKVASNQMDYQAATSLYNQSLKILKTAIGK